MSRIVVSIFASIAGGTRNVLWIRQKLRPGTFYGSGPWEAVDVNRRFVTAAAVLVLILFLASCEDGAVPGSAYREDDGEQPSAAAPEEPEAPERFTRFRYATDLLMAIDGEEWVEGEGWVTTSGWPACLYDDLDTTRNQFTKLYSRLLDHVWGRVSVSLTRPT